MLQKRLFGALCAALLLVAPAMAAEQSSYVAPTSGPMSMSTFAGTYLNPGLRALASCSWGSSAPANGPSGAPLPYQCWADTTASPVLFKYYDGASWVTYGALDTSTHVWTPYRNGAPIVAVATSGDASDLTTGTLPAARLPDPTSSTLGGVQSIAPTASQWLDSISTSGVPHASQPAFSDISGSWACTQAPALIGDISTSAGSCTTAIGAGKVTSSMLADTTVTPGSYGSASVITTFTVNAKGQITAASNASAAIPVGQVTGLGTGMATWLATPSSANLAAAVTDETGSGALVFGTSPTLTSPAITTPTGIVKGDVGLGNVDNTSDATKWAATATLTNKTFDTAGAGNSLAINGTAVSDVTGTGKVVLDASPALTGTPTAPTASPSDNSTKIATTAYVDAQVSAGVAGVASIDGQTGAFTTDDSLSSSSNVLRAQFKGHLYGLTLSNNATDATNDIDIAAGEAADADGNLMVLASGITKRLDAAWALGTNQGGLDTGSIANTTYHVFLIQRSDTGVVDVLFSTSATSPTMPTDYDRKRRIGSIIRPGGAILAFQQKGGTFKLVSSVADRNSTTGVSNTLLSLTVPSGIKVFPILGFAQQQGTAGDVFQQIADGDVASVTTLVARTANANERETSFNTTTLTNTSGQIRYSLTISSGTAASATVTTFGWIDDRGRN